LWDMGVDGVTMPRRCRCGIIGDGVEVYHGVPSNHVRQLRCDIFRGSSFEVLSFLVHLRSCAGSLDDGGWNVVGRGSGMRVAAGPDGVGVGVDVWVVSVADGVGLAMRFCLGGADADLAESLSGIISIGVVVVSGLSS